MNSLVFSEQIITSSRVNREHFYYFLFSLQNWISLRGMDKFNLFLVMYADCRKQDFILTLLCMPVGCFDQLSLHYFSWVTRTSGLLLNNCAWPHLVPHVRENVYSSLWSLGFVYTFAMVTNLNNCSVQSFACILRDYIAQHSIWISLYFL